MLEMGMNEYKCRRGYGPQVTSRVFSTPGKCIDIHYHNDKTGDLISVKRFSLGDEVIYRVGLLFEIGKIQSITLKNVILRLEDSFGAEVKRVSHEIFAKKDHNLDIKLARKHNAVASAMFP